MNPLVLITVLITLVTCAIITALLYSFKKLSRRVTMLEFNKSISKINRKIDLIEERVNNNMKKLETAVKEDISEAQEEFSEGMGDIDDNLSDVKENMEELVQKAITNMFLNGQGPGRAKNTLLPIVIRLHEDGKSLREIEKLTGVSKTTVGNWLKQNS